MSKENRFGKWGAWVAAAGIAVGGGHELLNNGDRDKPKSELVDDRNDDNNYTDHNTKKIPNNSDSKGEIDNPIKDIIQTNDKMRELKNKDTNKFLYETNQQLYSKLTTADTEKLIKETSFDDQELIDFRTNQLIDDSKHREKGDEYAKNDPQFDRIKKNLEIKYPNSIISIHNYINSDGEDAHNFYIEQRILSKDLQNIDFKINFSIDKNGIIASPESILSWAASDEKTFFETLDKSIKLSLLKKYFIFANLKNETNADSEAEGFSDLEEDELKESINSSQFISWLKSSGLFEEFKNLL